MFLEQARQFVFLGCFTAYKSHSVYAMPQFKSESNFAGGFTSTLKMRKLSLGVMKWLAQVFTGSLCDRAWGMGLALRPLPPESVTYQSPVWTTGCSPHLNKF